MVVIIDNRRKLPGTASRGSGGGGNSISSRRKRKNDEKSKYWETADGRTIWKDNTNNNNNDNDEMNLDFDEALNGNEIEQVSRPMDQQITDCDKKIAARITTAEGECNEVAIKTYQKQQEFSSYSYQTPVSSKPLQLNKSITNSSTVVCSSTIDNTNNDNFGLLQKMEQQIEFLQEQLKLRDNELQQYHSNQQQLVSVSKRIINTTTSSNSKTPTTMPFSPRKSSILIDKDNNMKPNTTPKITTRASTPKIVTVATAATTAITASTPRKSKKIINTTKIRSPPPLDMLPRRTCHDTLLLSSKTSMVVDVDCAYDDVILDNTSSITNNDNSKNDLTVNQQTKELNPSTTLVVNTVDIPPLTDANNVTSSALVTDTKVFDNHLLKEKDSEIERLKQTIINLEETNQQQTKINNNHELKEKDNEIEKLKQIIINLEETNQQQTKTILQIQEQLVTNDDNHIRQVQKSIETYQNEVLQRDIEIQQYKKDATNYNTQLNEEIRKVKVQYENKFKQIQDQHQCDIETKNNELQTIQLELANAASSSMQQQQQQQQQQQESEAVDNEIIIKEYQLKIDNLRNQLETDRRSLQDKIDQLTVAHTNKQRKRSEELQKSNKHISELQELIRTIQHEQQKKKNNTSNQQQQQQQQQQNEQSHAVGNFSITGNSTSTSTSSSTIKKSVEYVSLQNELLKVRSAHGTCIDRIEQLERRIERRDHTIQKLKVSSITCDSNSSRINKNNNNIVINNRSTTTPHYQRLSGSRTMNNNNNNDNTSTVRAVPTIGNTMNGPVNNCSSTNTNKNRNLTNNNNNNTMNKKRKYELESLGQSSRGVILRNTPPVIIPFPTSFSHPATAAAATTTTGTAATTATATARMVAATTTTKPSTSLSFSSDT